MNTRKLLLAMVMLGSTCLQAGSINFSGIVDGVNVDATAVFNFGNGTFTVAITNNVIGPGSVAQNLSGLSFVLSNASSAVLSGVSGSLISINSAGNFTNTVGLPDWFQDGGLNNHTTALGSSGPDNTLVGAPCQPGINFGCSNSSIRGNGPHNPFAVGRLLLTYIAPGVTSETTVQRLVFEFGTGPTAVTALGEPDVTTPEIPSFAMAGLAAVAGLFMKKSK